MAEPQSQSFDCPACRSGSFDLAVEMVQHTIYVCSGCSAALWLMTDEGRRLNTTRAGLIDRLKRSASESN